MTAKKDWVQKLQNRKDLPQIKEVNGKMSTRWGKGSFVIPAPIEVDQIMAKVPKGKVTTINEIRRLLAEKHKVNFACPVTTGIFAWIAAYAAEQRKEEGKKKTTPYWRTLKTGGFLNPKYPGGVGEQGKKLKKEGLKIARKGSNNYVVVDHEKFLAKINLSK
ncbi:MAG: hypothetical protein ABH867_00765 [Patescibacteria group bacterium]|nr:MGMT family protein [Patescibacteria group bacterium]